MVSLNSCLAKKYRKIYENISDLACQARFPNPNEICRYSADKINSFITQMETCTLSCALPEVQMFQNTNFSQILLAGVPNFNATLFNVNITGNIGDVVLIDCSIAAAVIQQTSNSLIADIFYTLQVDGGYECFAGFEINNGLGSGNGFNIETSKLQYGLVLASTTCNITVLVTVQRGPPSEAFVYSLNAIDSGLNKGLGAYLRITKFSGGCSSIYNIFPAEQNFQFTNTANIIPATNITVPANSLLLLDAVIFANMSISDTVSYTLKINGASVATAGFQSASQNLNQYETSMLAWAYTNNTGVPVVISCLLVGAVNLSSTVCTVIFSGLRAFITSHRAAVVYNVDTQKSWSMATPSGNFTKLFSTNIGNHSNPSTVLIDFIASTETDYTATASVSTNAYNSYMLSINNFEIAYAGFQPDLSALTSPSKYETSDIVFGISLPAGFLVPCTANACWMYSNSSTSNVSSTFGGTTFPSSSGYFRAITFY